MQSTPEAIKAYLPESLHDMMAVISLQSLLILIKTQGGTRVIIPKNIKPDHWLVGLIGMDDVKKLAALYGGELVKMPRCTKLLALARDIKILQDRRARLSGAQLALKYGMTERGIHKSLRRIEPHERQPWLKDMQASLTAVL